MMLAKLTGALVLLLMSAHSFAQSSNGNTGSNIPAAAATEVLAQHNKARLEVGVAPLAWSNKLSAYAQEWATYLAQNNGCDMKHRQPAGEDGKTYGENIFWGSSSAYTAGDASLAWYSEKAGYTYAKLSMDNWRGTGHYTQMVWKYTKEVGAGMATCPGGEVIIVANYFPAGNVLSYYPY